ncbi:MAG TPA: hypothetical protein VK826_19330 [Bacteroidia bacterium]|nr:hypothetical protein [Bacteroidia bacterium]
MNIRLSIIAVTVLSIVCMAWTINRAPRKARKYAVTGTIFEVRMYCGGAEPENDVLNPKPIPTAGVKLYIRHSKVNTTAQPVFDSIVSDANGRFRINLAAGTYCFVEAWKTKKLVMPVNNQYEIWDTTCYRQQYTQCDYSLVVKSKMDSVSITLNRGCPWGQPCSEYYGPLPPSSPPVNSGGGQPGHQE